MRGHPSGLILLTVRSPRPDYRIVYSSLLYSYAVTSAIVTRHNPKW